MKNIAFLALGLLSCSPKSEPVQPNLDLIARIIAFPTEKLDSEGGNYLYHESWETLHGKFVKHSLPVNDSAPALLCHLKSQGMTFIDYHCDGNAYNLSDALYHQELLTFTQEYQ
jgi:hypothetical protein